MGWSYPGQVNVFFSERTTAVNDRLSIMSAVVTHEFPSGPMSEKLPMLSKQ